MHSKSVLFIEEKGESTENHHALALWRSSSRTDKSAAKASFRTEALGRDGHGSSVLTQALSGELVAVPRYDKEKCGRETGYGYG